MRTEPPSSPVTVHVPLAEIPTVGFHAEEPPGPPPPEPFSIADEYRDRWLRMIEIDISPAPVSPPPPAETSK